MIQPNELAAVKPEFTKEAIHKQLKRIFEDSAFVHSDILRRFLSFIVDQALLGHANWLKEYTIAVQVLNKPASFKPQENGIVRIHAGRLRRALNHYYNEKGALDPIRISVPKGSYVPVFNEEINETSAELPAENNINQSGKTVVAVIPFRHLQHDLLEDTLADGVGVLLSTTLMRWRKFSVVAYYAMRNLYEQTSDFRTIAPLVGAQYIVTGDIQSRKDRTRIYVQVINASTNEQVWSQMYERKISFENIFEMQDEIVNLTIAELEESWNLMSGKSMRVSITAVA
jgi:TolB-like protein